MARDINLDESSHEKPFYPTFADWVTAQIDLGGFSGLARTLDRELPQLADGHVELLGSELRRLLDRVRAEQQVRGRIRDELSSPGETPKNV